MAKGLWAGRAWLALVYAFLYAPLLYMVVFSFNSTRQDARYTGFSWRWYEALLNDTKLVDGFWLSVQVATLTGLLSVWWARLRRMCWCVTAASVGAAYLPAWRMRLW